MIRFLPALLLLTGCAAAPPLDPVEIVVSRDREGCTALIEGRTYPAMTDSAALRHHIADLKARRRRARLVAAFDAPYRCVGGIIYQAQRARLRMWYADAFDLSPVR